MGSQITLLGDEKHNLHCSLHFVCLVLKFVAFEWMCLCTCRIKRISEDKYTVHVMSKSCLIYTNIDMLHVCP